MAVFMPIITKSVLRLTNLALGITARAEQNKVKKTLKLAPPLKIAARTVKESRYIIAIRKLISIAIITVKAETGKIRGDK
jgi:hypothetical protein